MPNFQLKYVLLVVFNKIIYYVFSAPKLFMVRLGQKVLKFEFAKEVIIIFIKNTPSGTFTSFVSQKHKQQTNYQETIFKI